jgi:hypothetical protein
MAELIRDHGIPHRFPWLYYTILRDNFVDHQLFFHLLLIPFVTVLGPILGAKIFQVIVVSCSFMLFYLILKKNRVQGALVLTLIALFCMPADFYFRMNFIRVMGLSLLFMTTGIYAVFNQKKWWVGILCFFYVWTYGGFAFLPIFAVTYFVAQLMTGEKPKWIIPLLALTGTILGLVLNPYFPQNIEFLQAQIFQTGFGAQWYSGGEWKPFNTWFWVRLNFIPIIVFFGCIVIALTHQLKQDAEKLSVFIYSIFLLVFAWKAKRFVEYSPFFMMLSSSLIVKGFIDQKLEEWRRGILFRNPQNLIYGLIAIALIPASASYATSSINQARRSTRTWFSMSAVEKVHQYLIEKSQPGDIVFTDDWGVFPKYFFVNSKTYYIVGLDPEFMNQYDGPPYEGKKGALYREFTMITSISDFISLDHIKTIFNAKWVIVNTGHAQLARNLRNQPALFQEVLYAGNDPLRDDYPSAHQDGYFLFKVL